MSHNREFSACSDFQSEHHSSMITCHRCNSLFFSRLMFCPYCGSRNQNIDEDQPSMDIRAKFRLCSSAFYSIFTIISISCAILVVIHDVFCNIINNFGNVSIFMAKVRVCFYVLYLIQTIMFCHWAYTHHSGLHAIKFSGKIHSGWAWLMFIPVLNLYFPEVVVKNLERTLFNIGIRDINIRTVATWWPLQIITNLYLIISSFIPATGGWFYLIVLCELFWACSIVAQALILIGFQKGMAKGFHKTAGQTEISSDRYR